ncbi:MAG: hypothetical protein E6R03_08195 [Hyphomicrobiaceae bacterium]|nr:MAG: hypothetical protein E6R03_08195 [Hyphomicrobiaceae bacterium]
MTGTDIRENTNVSELLSIQIGQSGVDTITNTSATTPKGGASQWCMIQALEDTVIAAISEEDATLNGSTSTNTLAGLTLTAGNLIAGSFTSITLTSGKVRCYREAIR